MEQTTIGNEQALWNELADFGMDHLDLASDHLLATLCRLGDAQSATWVAGVRLPDEADDPLNGWRVVHHRSLNAPPAQMETFNRLEEAWEKREVDPSFLLAVENTGQHRSYTFRDRLPASWFESPYYRKNFAPLGVFDIAIVCVPVNCDTELHYVFHRKERELPFSTSDLERLAWFPPRLGHFHRNLLLGYGVLLASSPLTPRERRVLQGLLGPGGEKEIAEQCGLAPSTTHQYIVSIYRKFGVSGRPGLVSLWLN